MYYKIFTIVMALIAFVAIIAGTTTMPVIGQQNQPINITTLLTSTPEKNYTTTTTAPETSANKTTTSNNVDATVVASNVTAPANMTIEDAKELYLSAWNQTKFNATFSTFVEPFSVAGYGVYEERSNVFSPGEAIVLYIEPVGFGHKQIINKEGDDGSNNNNTMLYLMNITADYEIDAANGTKLQLIEDVQAGSITSHRPNTEMPLTLTITPEVQPLPVGSYVVTYSVTDEISGESFQLKKDIIVADRKG